jgi:hypothetical protein
MARRAVGISSAQFSHWRFTGNGYLAARRLGREKATDELDVVFVRPSRAAGVNEGHAIEFDSAVPQVGVMPREPEGPSAGLIAQHLDGEDSAGPVRFSGSDTYHFVSVFFGHAVGDSVPVGGGCQNRSDKWAFLGNWYLAT